VVARVARLLLVPTSNGLPAAKGGPELIIDARRRDVARARVSRVPVVRAGVAGIDGDLVSYGSSGIVDPEGKVLANGRVLTADLLTAEVCIDDAAEVRRGAERVTTRRAPCAST
jgi:5-aminopentanamidase